MESEVSGIARLGVVLLALAVLIGLGFGIFQISKGTANTGVTRVQAELDGVSESVYTSYDQTIITGTMVRSAQILKVRALPFWWQRRLGLIT